MSGTLWDSFDHLLEEAENHFLNFEFEKALELWENYYRITARTEYEKITKELKSLWNQGHFTSVQSLQQLFQVFLDLRDRYTKRQISYYTYNLFKKLMVKIYQEQFHYTAHAEISLESGVFEYLIGHYDMAIEALKQVIQDQNEALIPRIFLGYSYIAIKEQQPATAILTQNLFLAADELNEDDLYLSQFKLLLGRLFSRTSHRKEAAWLLPFESWYRNYLIIEEDEVFYRMMQEKERNERIMQVKYYSYERYRHFVRSLFIAEYTRLFAKNEAGLIADQEDNMRKVDGPLFARYRRKRKAII